MASTKLNLIQYLLKRNDGKGEAYTFNQSASAVVNAAKVRGLNSEGTTIAYVYYSAQSAGVLDELDVDLTGCKSEQDRIMRVFDRYTFAITALDDDGNVLGEAAVEEGEPDPT